MRVGYLTYGLDRAPTGIGRHVVQLLAALARLPEAPELVLLTTEREDRHELWSHFERHPLRGCRLLPGLLTLGNAALSAATARLGLDLIHDPNGVAPFLGPAVGARRIVTIHDAIPFRYGAQHNRLDNWRFRLMLPLAARRADTVLTVSESAAHDLRHFLRLPEAHVRAIPNAVDGGLAPAEPAAIAATLDRYNLPRSYLLYVGGLNGRKNIAGLLEAFATVRSNHPSLNLVIVGKRQWHAGSIDAALERHTLEAYVRFTGYLPDADLPALYGGAAAFVFPSLYEGFGLPVLEAMACGAPVITSNVSSLPEVAGNAALMVDPRDTAALAGAIERLLTDSALAAEQRRKGLERAAQFSWQRTARETLAVYRQLLERGSGAGRRTYAL